MAGELCTSSASPSSSETSLQSTTGLGLREVDPANEAVKCKLCFLPARPLDEAGNPLQLGTLYEYVVDLESDVYCAHYNCLLFSSGLEQGGDDDLGIKGFLPEDILKEWRRGQRLKCYYCAKAYATIGCSTKSCKKSYHLPCAIKNRSLQQFCGEFASFCSDHKPTQAGDRSAIQEAGEPVPCGVCLEDMGPTDDLLWGPCCLNW